ncbi:MAG: serine/threonine protein kinase, partial [Oscillochloris sp.]|nr:serine/threonine protein kinase [Oscillochloris sp.]
MTSNPAHLDYQLADVIGEGRDTIIYRGYRRKDQVPVIIKTLRPQLQSQRGRARLRHEYQITHDLDIPSIVRALALSTGGEMLVLEETGGIVLSDMIPPSGLAIDIFLRLAIALGEAITILHTHGVIHKDIKPRNIITDVETNRIWLCDFGIASRLSQESQQANAPHSLEGTLAYMSPEQTGRMNRVIDYRTDYYALGATFYEMLTGELPFQASDPMELVHCHIARRAVAPHLVRPAIPVAISDIVMKLLSKTAEERYQSGRGICVDLEHCQSEWTTTGQIVPFLLGANDQAENLHISQKLYGREQELQQLLVTYERASTGPTG